MNQIGKVLPQEAVIPNYAELRGKAKIENFDIKSVSVVEGHNIRSDVEPSDELIRSVRKTGILNPLHVRWLDFPNKKVSIIDGERRYRAALKAGLKGLPCINYGFLDDALAVMIAFAANENRKPLTTSEKLRAIGRLVSYGYGAVSIGKIMGLEDSTVARYQAALKASPRLKKAVEQGKVSVKTAAAASTLPVRAQAKIAAQAGGKTDREAHQVVVEQSRKNVFRPKIFSSTPVPSTPPVGKVSADLPENFAERLNLLERMIRERLELRPENKILNGQMLVIHVLKGKLKPTDLFPVTY